VINQLALTQNAQFYFAPVPMTDLVLLEILNAASENLAANSAFLHDESRVERTVDNQFTYKYSLRIYPSAREVYFLDGVNLHDTIHSYILILEIDGVIVVLRKSAANVADVLQNYFDLVNHESLISTFNDDEVEFQKLALRNMTVSDKAIRARSFEAVDLKGVVSVYAAGRSIPYFLKLRQGNTLRTITTTTGRIAESAQRKGIDDIAIWAKQLVEKIVARRGRKSFLDAFASPIDLKDVLSVTQPIAILIEVSSFLERIQNDDPHFYKKSSHGLEILRVSWKDKLLRAMEHVLEIDAAGKITGRFRHSKIRTNPKTITFRARVLTKIFLFENGREITLQKYLIKHGLYSVCFSNPKYMYFRGNCFEDKSGSSEIDQLLRMLLPQPDLSRATSEKGSVTAASTVFDATSIFGIVETLHATDDYILCDDLGDEWADHICFNIGSACISFIHSKYGDASTSASNFHDVVGQGLKNIGNMFFTRGFFTDKKKRMLSQQYTGSGINRLRKGTRTSINADIDKILSDSR